MRKSTLVGGLAAALASMVLVLPPPAVVSAQTGGGSGDDYADLFVALRDVDGVPILSPTFWEVGPPSVPVTCIQPISSAAVPGILPTNNPADGRDVYLIPLVGEGSTADLPVEADTACDPQAEFLPYVSEVELERLNLVRTSDEVLWKKLVDVGARLDGADDITLDGAGRITTWTGGVATAIDASPDQAAIYAANQGTAPAPPPPADGKPGAGQPGGLMDTGTIPYWLPVGSDPPNPLYPVGNPALIVQPEGALTGFDNWELAAAAIGTATSKSVPVTIDTIQYYNRIASRGVDNWDYAPKLTKTANSEKFVDYTEFSYTRSEVYQGCTTWLDVPTLRWKYAYILDRVDFGDLPPVATGGTVSNVAGFAQLADDVRSVIDYLHNNEVVVNPDTGEGFFIDPVFTESCDAQAAMVDKLNTAVDPSPPTVTITAAPTSVTTATDATFAFTANADATSVLCVLDGGPIELCVSPKTYTGLEPGVHTFTVIAGSTAGNFVSDTHTWTILPPGEDTMITPLTPVRFADTRTGWVAADGLFFGMGPVSAGGIVEVPVAGRGGVPADAKAVVANVTLVGAAGPGYATVFPCGTLPGTSSVNYLAGGTVANEVIAKLSPTGSICVFTSAAANVLVDVAGYVPASSDFVSLTPVRLADTRPTPVAGGQFVEVPVAGRGGVPADAKAVVANVTLVGAAGPGYATVFPCGTLPGTSSVNYLAGGTVANEVIAKLSPTGSICVFTSAAANVLVDVAGYVPASSDFVSLTPVRLADTRPTPVAGGQFVEVPVAGRGGVPADAKAVVANVTLVGAAGPGYATVFPCGTLPGTSSVNYLAGGTVANEVIAKLSPTGSICVFTSAAANVLVDIAGSI
jgi:hypothetical protein